MNTIKPIDRGPGGAFRVPTSRECGPAPPTDSPGDLLSLWNYFTNTKPTWTPGGKYRSNSSFPHSALPKSKLGSQHPPRKPSNPERTSYQVPNCFKVLGPLLGFPLCSVDRALLRSLIYYFLIIPLAGYSPRTTHSLLKRRIVHLYLRILS